MNSVLPTEGAPSHRNVHGIFGEGTNVSLLLQLEDEAYFLPTCIHSNIGITETLTISKVNNGYVWARQVNLTSAFVSVINNRLIPLKPPKLSAAMTGVYKCSRADPNYPQFSSHQYQLEVVGKRNVNLPCASLKLLSDRAMCNRPLIILRINTLKAEAAVLT